VRDYRVTYLDPGSTWSSALPGRPTAPFLPDLTFQNPFPSTVETGPPSNPLLYTIGRNNVSPVTQQWSLTVEQQFREDWVVQRTAAEPTPLSALG
jgi:hypothetical protein